jgi:hypothetical protein
LEYLRKCEIFLKLVAKNREIHTIGQPSRYNPLYIYFFFQKPRITEPFLEPFLLHIFFLSKTPYNRTISGTISATYIFSFKNPRITEPFLEPFLIPFLEPFLLPYNRTISNTISATISGTISRTISVTAPNTYPPSNSPSSSFCRCLEKTAHNFAELRFLSFRSPHYFKKTIFKRK